MGNFLEKIASNLPIGSGEGSIIPTNIADNLSNIGQKGGQKYSNLVDKVVDSIFKK